MKETSVLFIGNSYTFFNEMPTAIFAHLAESEGRSLRVESITKGGFTLSKHSNPENEIGARVAAALDGAKQGKYDYVILQEQSVRPALDDARALFYDAVRDLAKRARAIGATPILYATWGRKAGGEKLDECGFTNESMTWRLAAAYNAIGKELDIAVAPVGAAFYDVYTNHGQEVELYNKDLSHPSYVGSFLAALTLYAKIFGTDPSTIPYRGDLTEAEFAILQAAAKRAVYNTPEIPADYQTSSQI